VPILNRDIHEKHSGKGVSGRIGLPVLKKGDTNIQLSYD
jgi:hypothetical protein